MKENQHQNFEAAMILAAVGDAMGYKRGNWEFQYNGEKIHQQMNQMTGGKGPLALQIDEKWIYSDDTVMHIATAKALQKVTKQMSIDNIAQLIAEQYVLCWKHMKGRAPGGTTQFSVQCLDRDGSNWKQIPYNKKGGGCGASMRSACIGLVFGDLDRIIGVSVEAGRITHHNPIAYLGSVVSSCFTHFALRKVDPSVWGALLFEQVFEKARRYIEKAGRQVQNNLSQAWDYFVNAWEAYLSLRKLSKNSKEPVPATFPQIYGVAERQQFYKSVSFSGWGGASGHDSVIIAYDAILGSRGSWEEFCLRGILHGGDNDSTGTIGGAWFGALWGYKGVPDNHRMHVEGAEQLKHLAESLLDVSKKQ